MKYKITFCLLMVTAILIISMITNKYVEEYENEKQIEQILEQPEKQEEYKGYKIIGILKISKINIEYPILEIENISPESAKEPMKISIIKYWGNKVNDYGNLSIAGHNNKSGTMFGKIKQLEKGDIIELKDLTAQVIKYSIYDIFIVKPDDLSVLLSKDENVREVTLITCTNGNKQRLIIKAQEI